MGVVWKGSELLLRQYAYENPTFAIQHLDIETDGVLSREQIQTWAGVRLQDNLLALNLARVKRDLELVPAIEAVAVERVLPRGLRIRVQGETLRVRYEIQLSERAALMQLKESKK